MAYLRKGTAFYPSTVTAGTLGSEVTFPTGHTKVVLREIYTAGGEYLNSSETFKTIYDAISFEVVSGRHYIVQSHVLAQPYVGSGGGTYINNQEMKLCVGTSARSQADTTEDTVLTDANIGYNFPGDSAASYGHFYGFWNALGSFTGGSTATHYVHIMFKRNTGVAGVRARVQSSSVHHCTTTIIEVMP